MKSDMFRCVFLHFVLSICPLKPWDYRYLSFHPIQNQDARRAPWDLASTWSPEISKSWAVPTDRQVPGSPGSLVKLSSGKLRSFSSWGLICTTSTPNRVLSCHKDSQGLFPEFQRNERKCIAGFMGFLVQQVFPSSSRIFEDWWLIHGSWLVNLTLAPADLQWYLRSSSEICQKNATHGPTVTTDVQEL